MFSHFRAFFLQASSICASIGGAYTMYLACLLLVDAVEGHGSREGTILRVGFGVLLILGSALMLLASIACWKSSKSPSKKISN